MCKILCLMLLCAASAQAASVHLYCTGGSLVSVRYGGVSHQVNSGGSVASQCVLSIPYEALDTGLGFGAPDDSIVDGAILTACDDGHLIVVPPDHSAFKRGAVWGLGVVLVCLTFRSMSRAFGGGGERPE